MRGLTDLALLFYTNHVGDGIISPCNLTTPYSLQYRPAPGSCSRELTAPKPNCPRRDQSSVDSQQTKG